MENLGFLLIALICPISMGLMMVFMMKGKKRGGDGRDEEPATPHKAEDEG